MEKPYYRKAADLAEFRNIMDEHGEGDICAIVEAALRGHGSKQWEDRAIAEMERWNALMDERFAEEAKPARPEGE